ncbi:Ctr copper transporter [Corchorus olitorius]|uniref:Copper transport protein n=1 Tax=Corchorus olitorius TaxID=93759 RepID=A0A1R3JR99_9ROSI|nr:Ctr copper transporter [Corchorus olitorius]
MVHELETTSAWNTTSGGLHVHRNSLLHMSFYWGHKSQILFSGWPGSNAGMYALALIFVFVLAMIVEWLSYCSIIKPGANKVAAGFFQTGMHTVRAGLSYMVMLAVMSFNGGVFLAAIFGHAVGFLIFGSRAFKKSDKKPDLPPRK